MLHTRMEVALFAIFQSIHRWQEECAAALGASISGPDNTILNVIRLNERPKALSDIGLFLNRTDLSNIQYSIRKLLQAELIQKTSSSGSKRRRDVTYEVTEQGRILTDGFAAIREELLMNNIELINITEEKINDVTQLIKQLGGIYENAAREAAMYQFSESPERDEPSDQ